MCLHRPFNWVFGLIFIYLLLLGNNAFAIDYSGTCNGTIPAAGGPHRLIGTCTVPAGDSLTIEAGAVLDGQNNTLFVDGTATINQVTLDRIRITARTGGQANVDQTGFTGTATWARFEAGSSGSVTNSTFNNTNCIIIADSSPAVTGNTLSNMAQGICVSGTSIGAPANPLIQNNTMSVRTIGIGFTSGTAKGTVDNNTIAFTGTSSNRRALDLDGDVSPVISNNTIQDDVDRSDFAFDINVTQSSILQITGNNVSCSGGDTPIRSQMGIFSDTFTGNVSANTFSCDLSVVRFQIGGTLQGASTLDALNGSNIFQFYTTLTVPAGQTLTVSPGISLVGSGHTFSMSGAVVANQVSIDNINATVNAGGQLNADQSSFINTSSAVNFSAGSSGSVTNSTFTNTGCLSINDASPVITGNTLTNLSSGICIRGTSIAAPANPLIQNNIINVRSRGIDFAAGTANGTVNNNTISFTGTSSSRIGIELDGAVSPVITNNNILDDLDRTDFGIDIDVTPASTVQVKTNTIACSGADAPLRVGPGIFTNSFAGDISGNTFGCDLSNTLIQIGGTLTGNTTLSALEGQSVFQMNTTLTIPAGLTLTIPAGISIDNTSGRTISASGTVNAIQASLHNASIDVRNGGQLSADQTTFTGTGSSINFRAGSTGTVTNNTFDNTACLTITDTSPTVTGNTFNNVSSGVCVAGSSLSSPASPLIENNTITARSRGIDYFAGTAQGTVNNNTIGFTGASSNRIAIELDGNVSPIVTNNNILDDLDRSDFGIDVDVTPTSTAQITSNTITCSGTDAPIRVGPGVFADVFVGDISGNTFTCDLANTQIQLSGTLQADTTLSPLEGQSTFKMNTTLTVPVGTSLTIPPGIAINNAAGRTLSVSGSVAATRVALTNVYMDVRDGGLVNVSQVDFAGTGGGVNFRAGSTGNVSNSTFTNTRCVTITDASPTISGNTLTNMSSAICVAGASVIDPAAPTIQNNIITARSRGIDYSSGTAGGTVDGNTISFIGTSSSRIGIEMEGNVSPTVTNNSIVDDVVRNDFQVYLNLSPASTLQFNNNTIGCSGGDAPIRFSMNVFANAFTGDISNNTFNCDLNTIPMHILGTLNADGVMAAIEGQSNYFLRTSATIPAGVSLSIPAGIEISSQGWTITTIGTLTVDQAVLDDVSVNVNNGGVFNVSQSNFIDTNTLIQYRLGSSGSITGSTFTNTGCLSITDASPTITGNTFTNVATGICVIGNSIANKANPLIDNNILSVRSRGIDFNNGTVLGTATNNTVGFTGTSTSRVAFRVVGSASPVINNNTVQDDFDRSDIGIDININPQSSVQVTDNSVNCSGSDTPLRLGTGVFFDTFTGSVTGNTFSCDLAVTQIRMNGGTWNSDATISPVSGVSDFRLDGTLTVASGNTLAVSPGITIDGFSNTIRVNGIFNADAATFNNIFFDMRNASSGSIISSTFNGPVNSTAITITNASPSFTNNVFQGAATAINLTGGNNVTFDSNLFKSNTTAVNVASATSLSTMTANVFDINTNALVFANDDALFSAYPADFDTSSFVGAFDRNALLLPSTINDSGTFPVAPRPFKNSSNLNITGGAVVTMLPGTVVTSTGSRQITVQSGSRLVATGTPEFPVVFTDFGPKDGSRWNGLVINDNTSLLENCVVEFSNADGLLLNGVSIPIDNCRISDNNRDGVGITGNASPDITNSAVTMNIRDGVRVNVSSVPSDLLIVENNSILSNGGFGINNLPGTFNVAGTLNYWGDDSGPFDGSDDTAVGGLYNPGGLGQSVSDGVLYDPWIRIGPTLEGSLVPLSGVGQSGTAGETLPNPMVISVESILGTPLEGIDVIFSVVQGDATIIENQPVQTDAAGQASAIIQLGLNPGNVLITATARDVNSPLATFAAEANAPCIVEIKTEPLNLSVSPNEPGQAGDINNDGIVNNQDSVLIQAVLDGVVPADSTLVGNFESSSDINQDGTIDTGDVLVIQGVQIGLLGQ